MSICVKTSVLANTVLESRSGASVKGWSLIFKEWDWWHWNNSDYWNRIKRHLSRNPGFWINRDVRFNRSRVDSGMYNFKYSRSNCEVLSGLRATGGRSVDLRKPQEVCRSKRGLRRGAGDLHSPDRGRGVVQPFILSSASVSSVQPLGEWACWWELWGHSVKAEEDRGRRNEAVFRDDFCSFN